MATRAPRTTPVAVNWVEWVERSTKLNQRLLELRRSVDNANGLASAARRAQLLPLCDGRLVRLEAAIVGSEIDARFKFRNRDGIIAAETQSRDLLTTVQLIVRVSSRSCGN